MIHINRHLDAASFHQRATHWLLHAEAEHNLLLGLSERLRTGNHPYGEPIYLATVEDGDTVVGCAMRTPPYKLLLTRMPEAALEPLIEDVAAAYPTLPAFLGPEAVARRCAELWCLKQGGRTERSMQQRIYALEKLIAPVRPAAGKLRPASVDDLELARRWNDQFFQDVGTTEAAPGLVERLISGNHLFIWEDGEPKSLVAGVGRTPHGIRISFVFTPPEFRRQGYATTCVAELSRRYLAEGLQFCFLYTDMANPTSNSIYQNIGYRQVCDVVDWQVI